jgi:peptide chain release factor 2
MELFEIKNLYESLSEKIEKLRKYLEIDKKIIKLSEINKEFEDGTIWNDADTDKVKLLTKEKSKLENIIKLFNKSITLKEEYEVYYEFYLDDKSNENFLEIETSITSLKEIVDKIEFNRMLSGEVDFNNSIISINAGSGGTESQDWAGMLYRMLSMYCEKNKYKVSILDYQSGDEAGKNGIKSITILAEGEYAYGLTKSENGVHRLVRISPFDSSARRHTSFASISVVPEVDDNIEIEINDDDVRVDTFRASGAGGQHVNKTDSAIRLTHFPTGIVVSCQNERSQHKNKESAFKVLKSRLYELELQKKQEEADKFNANKKEITWGSQIRSYVLHPYKMIKDHRTNHETGNVNAVLDGYLDEFIKAFLLEFGG